MRVNEVNAFYGINGLKRHSEKTTNSEMKGERES